MGALNSIFTFEKRQEIKGRLRGGIQFTVLGGAVPGSCHSKSLDSREVGAFCLMGP